MKRAFGAASWECQLFAVVLDDGESLAPDVAAVKSHRSCRSIGVPQGTTLSDALAKLKSRVHGEAEAFGLDEEGPSWVQLEPEILSYSCRAGDTFYFKFEPSPGVIDNSKAWACAVLKPFDFSVVEVEGLKKAMSEPLPLRLPVGDATYKELSCSASDFVPNSRYPAERIAGLVTSFVRSRTELGRSENAYQSVWDLAFCNLWRELLGLADVTTVDFDRNVTDPSGASAVRTRPDLMLWILNRLCAKFEEKRLKIEEAFADLETKLTNLDPQYYGPVKWIIGVALAGDRLAAWAMRRGHVPDSLSLPLRMTSVPDMAACLRFSVNLLRVALSLSGTYGNLVYLPRPYRRLQPLSYGKDEQITRTLRFMHYQVVKEITPWSEHVAEGFTQLEFVKKAYELQATGLISGDVKVTRGGTYKAVMNAVGYEHAPASEAELMVCLKDVLTGLKALHAAGLVHRDVRWKNVVKIPGNGFLLIDLETVWRCDEEPLCSSLRDWDERTLVDGRFMRSSDLQLVGKLLSSAQNLSQQARSFQLKLLSHQFATADQALEELDAFVHTT